MSITIIGITFAIALVPAVAIAAAFQRLLDGGKR
jgi:hypothetical protein